MRLLHSLAKTHASFDDPNLVSHAGLVPVMGLAQRAGLGGLVAEHVRPGGKCGVNAAVKVPCLVAGMAAGADSIDDMDVLRHGAMSTLFGGVRAPSTLGSHLRSYTWGNVSQLEKAGREFLARLAREAPLLPGAGTLAFIDIDSMQKRVYGHQKQGARFGHTKIQGEIAAGEGPERAGRGGQHAAVGAGGRRDQAARRQRRLRARRGQPRHAGHRRRAGLRLHRDDHRAAGLGLLQRRRDRRDPPRRRVLFRHRPHERQHPRRDRRHPRGCLDADPVPARVWDDQLGAWISDAEVAETEYTAFASKKGQAVTARLVVRRVRDLNKKEADGQDELFSVWRYHAVFTDSPFVLAQAEGQHRDHAVVEQVFADVTSGPLAHMPSGVFAANAAWLAIAAMAHNLLRAAGSLASLPFAKARAATIRRDLIAVAARTARHGRGHITLHLPEGWHREREWLNLLAGCAAAATA